jgi:hypothetical protein
MRYEAVVSAGRAGESVIIMRIATLAGSIVLNYLVLVLWFVERSTPLSMSHSLATTISLIGVAVVAIVKNLLTTSGHDGWYLSGALTASLMFVATALAIGWGLAHPVGEALPFGTFVQSALATDAVWLIGIVVGATLMASGGLWAGREIRRRFGSASART